MKEREPKEIKEDPKTPAPIWEQPKKDGDAGDGSKRKPAGAPPTPPAPASEGPAPSGR